MKIFRQAADVAWNRVGDQIVILALRPSDRQFHELSPSASIIWQSIDGIRTPEEIAERVTETFQVTPEEALADTQNFLEALSRHGLIESSS